MIPFLDRTIERIRLNTALSRKSNQLIILYGRRRIGKSTLIKNLLKPTDIFFVSDQREGSMQRAAMATDISAHISGFDKINYPRWESLFVNLNNILKKKIVLCIDEFPYLVKNSPELPSVLQKLFDNKLLSKIHLLLCGSSQQMMQGLVLDPNTPLYGRATEIIKLLPLSPYWLKEALHLNAIQTIEEYSIWGGIPRYWELRKQYKTMKEAVCSLILSPYGILHEEPTRLFLDDMRSSVQAYSLLAIIANGSTRLSEIASRFGKPATQIMNPLQNLISLSFISRQLPFGESTKTSKKTYYYIEDPFTNYYFKNVIPNISALEMGLEKTVYQKTSKNFDSYVSVYYERLCRKALSGTKIGKETYLPASSWWGSIAQKIPVEIDIISESISKESLIIGEVKWSNTFNRRWIDELNYKVANLAFINGRKVQKVFFLKSKPAAIPGDIKVFTPDDVLKMLK